MGDVIMREDISWFATAAMLTMPGGAGLDGILAEASKCAIVCAKCHREGIDGCRKACSSERE